MQTTIVCLAASIIIYFLFIFKNKCYICKILICTVNKDHVKMVGYAVIIAIILIFIIGIIYISLRHYVYTITINDIKYAIVGCDSHGLKLVEFYSYTDTSSIKEDNFIFNEYKPYKWISYEQAYNIKNDFKTEIITTNHRKKINAWLRNHKYAFLTLKSIFVIFIFYIAIEIIFEVLHLYVQFTSIFG